MDNGKREPDAQAHRRVKNVPESSARIEFRCNDELKELIGQAADEAKLPMNEYIAKVLAQHLGRLDLAEIPRISFGRPRKERASA